MPELGSPEAAVQAAVNLLAAVTKLDERKLAYWLDMYYQLRSRYEKEKVSEKSMEAMNTYFELSTALTKAEEILAEETVVPGVPDCSIDPVPESPAAKAAAEKRRIRERFMQARTNGVTLGAIRKAANGGITEESLRDIIESKPVPVAVYRVLDETLDHLQP